MDRNQAVMALGFLALKHAIDKRKQKQERRNARKRRLWRAVHNLIAHPLMELLPEKLGDRFHDWTADKAGIAL